MLSFAKGGTTPPGGLFFYADPGNGVPLVQDRVGLTSLVSRVRAAYAKSGKTPPEPLAAVVEAYICERVPRGFCVGRYAGDPVDFVTPQEVRRKSLEFAAGCPRADPGTTKARMCICGTCPDNSHMLCMSCTGLTDWAVRLAGRTRVAHDDALGICRHDRVFTSLLVSLNPPPVDGDRPPKCWRLACHLP